MQRSSSAAILGLVIGALGLAGAAQAADPSPRQIKAAAAKYQDVKAAIADGYTTDGKCMDARMIGYPASAGAMGVHYVRKDLIGIKPAAKGARVTGTGTNTDFLHPSMLVYEPEADGSLKLVALENLVFQSAWQGAGRKGPPKFHGVDYVLLKDDPATKVDEAHNYQPHYELHAWVFRSNPKGVYAEFNPDVTCAHSAAFKPM